MISSWLVLYLGLGDIMNKHTAKRLAEINSKTHARNIETAKRALIEEAKPKPEFDDNELAIIETLHKRRVMRGLDNYQEMVDMYRAHRKSYRESQMTGAVEIMKKIQDGSI